MINFYFFFSDMKNGPKLVVLSASHWNCWNWTPGCRISLLDISSSVWSMMVGNEQWNKRAGKDGMIQAFSGSVILCQELLVACKHVKTPLLSPWTITWLGICPVVVQPYPEYEWLCNLCAGILVQRRKLKLKQSKGRRKVRKLKFVSWMLLGWRKTVDGKRSCELLKEGKL